MKRIHYQIYLEQPLLATSLQGDANSSVSFNYVPGSQIRGLLIHRYIERNKLYGTDVADNNDCRRLFFDGTTRYLNCYPLTDNDRRSLPTPMAFQKLRSVSSERVYNASHQDWNAEARRDVESDDQLKPLDWPFCVEQFDGSISLYKPQPNTVSIHVLRERSKGRATPDKGAVFQYDALAKGQWFAGVILLDTDADASIISDLLEPKTAWIGRSRSAEYGKIRIEVQPNQSGGWRETGDAVPANLGQHATITLLSDTILRDCHGNAVAKLTNEILSAYLRRAVEIISSHSWSATTQHGGFNRTWQMPLTQTWALRAGTVIAFQPQEAVDQQALLDLEQQGIGERRAEGFGRIAFNWFTDFSLQAHEGTRKTGKRNSPVSLSPIAQALAQRMAKQLLATQIEQGIIGFIHAKSLINPPRNSQLGRVRVLIRRAIRQEYNLAVVREGMATFKDTARQQFQAASIEGKPLWIWITNLLAEPAKDIHDTPLPSYEDVWDTIKQLNTPWPNVAGQPALREPQITRATTLRLIDAVLAQAARERKRPTLELTTPPQEARI